MLKFREIYPTGNWHNCALFTSQKTKFWQLLCRYCADRAQNLPRTAPNICLTLFQTSSKSVHFRRSYSQTHVRHSFAPQSISMIRPRRSTNLLVNFIFCINYATCIVFIFISTKNT